MISERQPSDWSICRSQYLSPITSMSRLPNQRKNRQEHMSADLLRQYMRTFDRPKVHRAIANALPNLADDCWDSEVVNIIC